VTAVPDVLPHAPDWFVRAVAAPRTDGSVEVDGCAVHYLVWGEPGRRGLVFGHGGGAHAHWWTPVAATFAGAFRVVAVDLSGHGDSGRRDSYDPEISAREAFGRSRVYATPEEAIARFRTVPPQDHYLDYVIDYVARHSLRPAADGTGWVWKFDRRIFEQFGDRVRGIAVPYLERVHCRLALLRSECGLVTPEIGAFMFEKLGRVTPVIEIPEAGHHAMLDQPLILLTALRTLLADWDHSEPHRR
jgi:pimeloyl-ACP methyl ester carboxylesterase